MKLTPHPILLSLSIRLLQVTVAISLPAAKDSSKGTGFLRASDRKVPTGKCRISKGGREGSFSGEPESFAKRKVPRTSGRGGSRSIWPSKLGLSCNKFLLARVVLSLCMGEDLLVVCFLWLGQLYLLPGKFPSRCVFKRCICWGTFRLELNQKTAERLFESASARGDGWLRRLRNEAWKK